MYRTTCDILHNLSYGMIMRRTANHTDDAECQAEAAGTHPDAKRLMLTVTGSYPPPHPMEHSRRPDFPSPAAWSLALVERHRRS